jgi:hypothetical protein
MPDPLFERLYGETRKMNWPTAADIRQRGDHRVARRRVAVVVAAFATVLAVAALSTVLIGLPSASPVPPGTDPPAPITGTPGPATPTRSTGTPTRTRTGTPRQVADIPTAAMLQPDDLGPGVTSSSEVLGDWMIQFTLSLCDAPNRDQQPGAVDDREQVLDRPDSVSVNQRMTAYAAGDARTAFDRLRAEVVACARIDNQLSGGLITMDILAESFAGQQSMLVATRAQGRGFQHIVVREGNLISQLSVYPVDEAMLRTMTDRAVARMCGATGGC